MTHRLKDSNQQVSSKKKKKRQHRGSGGAFWGGRLCALYEKEFHWSNDRWLDQNYHQFSAPQSLFDSARSFADLLGGLFAQRWPGAIVDLFGSCASGLAGPDSDVDLVAHGHADLVRGDATAIVDVQRFLECECFLDIVEVRQVLNARVPLLQFTARVRSLEIQVDLSLGQPVKRYNSLLLKAYADLDPRSEFLLVIVRSWAKKRGISTVYREHTPSPYAHALLVITYLQTTRFLPNLQPFDRVPELVDGIDVSYTKGLPGNQLSGQVWKSQTGMFRHANDVFGADVYLERTELFEDYLAWLSNQLDPVSNGLGVSAIVSPRLGMITHKSSSLPDAWRLSIEDPFEHFASARPRDLGDVLSPEGQMRLFLEVQRARQLLASRDNASIRTLFDDDESAIAPQSLPYFQSEKLTNRRGGRAGGRSTHRRGKGLGKKKKAVKEVEEPVAEHAPSIEAAAAQGDPEDAAGAFGFEGLSLGAASDDVPRTL